MVVIGGGVIGLELGSVWRRLGAKVTVVEFLDQILPGFDDDVRKEANKIFKKQGIEFKLGDQGHRREVDGDNGVSLTVEPAKGGAAETIEADVVLVSIGRRPNTDGLALDKAGLKLNQRGQIEIDHDFRTKVAGVWAIGDVIPGPMLAHKAEDEGIAVAENIAGQTGIVNHDVIPSRGLHHARNRRRRPDRGAGEGAGRGQGRQVPDARQQPRQDQPRARRLREGHRRRQDRPRARRVGASPRSAGTMIAQAAQAMEFGATQRGHRLHLPRPPDALAKRSRKRRWR